MRTTHLSNRRGSRGRGRSVMASTMTSSSTLRGRRPGANDLSYQHPLSLKRSREDNPRSHVLISTFHSPQSNERGRGGKRGGGIRRQQMQQQQQQQQYQTDDDDDDDEFDDVGGGFSGDRKSDGKSPLPLYLQPGHLSNLRNIRIKRPLRGTEVHSPLFFYDAASLKLDFEIQFEDYYESLHGRTVELYSRLQSISSFGEDEKRRLSIAWLYNYLKGEEGGSVEKYVFCLRTYWSDVVRVLKTIVTKYIDRLLVHVLVRILNLVDSSLLISLAETEELLPLLLRRVRSGNTSEMNVYLAGQLVYLYERHYPVIRRDGLIIPSALYTFTRLTCDHFESMGGRAENAAAAAAAAASWPPTATDSMLGMSSVGAQGGVEASLTVVRLVFEHEMMFCVNILKQNLDIVDAIGRDYVRILQPVLKLYSFKSIWAEWVFGKPEVLKRVLATPTDIYFITSRIPPAVEKIIYFILVESRAPQETPLLLDWIKAEIENCTFGSRAGSFISDLARYLAAVTGISSACSVKRRGSCHQHGQRESILRYLLSSVRDPKDICQIHLAIFFDFILPITEPVALNMASLEFGLSFASHLVQQNEIKAVHALIHFLLNFADHMHDSLSAWFRSNMSSNFHALLSVIAIARQSGSVLNVITNKARISLAFILGGTLISGIVTKSSMFSGNLRYLRSGLIDLIPKRTLDELSLYTIWYRIADTRAAPAGEAKAGPVDPRLAVRTERSSDVITTTPAAAAVADVASAEHVGAGLLFYGSSSSSSSTPDRMDTDDFEAAGEKPAGRIESSEEDSFEMLKRVMHEIASADESGGVGRVVAAKLAALCSVAMREDKLDMVVNVLGKLVCDSLADIRMGESLVLWKPDSMPSLRTGELSGAIWAVPLNVLCSLSAQADEEAFGAVHEFIVLLYRVDDRYGALILLGIACEQDAHCASVLQAVFRSLDSGHPAVIVKRIWLSCADWNDSLFTFLLPYVLETFSYFVGGFDIIEKVCTRTNQRQVSEMTLSVSLGVFQLMSQQSALGNVRASLRLDSHSLNLFFQLLEAHSLWVPLSSYADAFSSPLSHILDSTLAQILKREQTPTEHLVRVVLSRPPDSFSAVVLSGWCVQLAASARLALLVQHFLAVAAQVPFDRLVAHVNSLRPLPMCKGFVSDARINQYTSQTPPKQQQQVVEQERRRT